MEITRRHLIRTGAAAIAAGCIAPATAISEPDKPLPKRVLGRTGARVSMLGYGTAPLGQSFQSQAVFDRLIGHALDLGVNYIDTATIYDIAQERLGPIVRRNRDRMFLVSKTRGMTRAGALRTIEESLRLLQTNHIDLVHLHNVPEFDVERILDDNSALRGLQEAKRRGWIRFLGATAHLHGDRMIPVIETGLIDVIMVTLNFVDRYTYPFESRVLPVARKHQTGIVAMKTLCGARGYNYRNPTPCAIPPERVRDGVRYALSLPGVACAVVGMNFEEQLLQHVQTVRAFRPLAADEKARLAKQGKELATAWREHLGPA